jgi:fructose-1,6-bisphosphatase/sedoheptulose 1,7-bisphosphatase-like protein
MSLEKIQLIYWSQTKIEIELPVNIKITTISETFNLQSHKIVIIIQTMYILIKYRMVIEEMKLEGMWINIIDHRYWI